MLRGHRIFHCFSIGLDLSNSYCHNCFPFPRSPLISFVHLKIFDKNKNSHNHFKALFLASPYCHLLGWQKGSSGLFQDIRSSLRVLFSRAEAASVLGVVRINHLVHWQSYFSFKQHHLTYCLVVTTCSIFPFLSHTPMALSVFRFSNLLALIGAKFLSCFALSHCWRDGKVHGHRDGGSSGNTRQFHSWLLPKRNEHTCPCKPVHGYS